MKDPNALIVFIKNPTFGKVKTRLAKTMGDEKALEIYKKLLLICHNASSKVQSQKYLYYSDFIDTDDLWDNSVFNKKLQPKGDIGRRMFVAFENTLKNHKKTILIGSDIPLISNSIIESAFRALDQNDIVLGPTNDGGYYLIGMKNTNASLFQSIPWSTNYVLQKTLEIATLENLSFHLIDTLDDIDFEEDLTNYNL